MGNPKSIKVNSVIVNEFSTQFNNQYDLNILYSHNTRQITKVPMDNLTFMTLENTYTHILWNKWRITEFQLVTYPSKIVLKCNLNWMHPMAWNHWGLNKEIFLQI